MRIFLSVAIPAKALAKVEQEKLIAKLIFFIANLTEHYFEPIEKFEHLVRKTIGKRLTYGQLVEG